MCIKKILTIVAISLGVTGCYNIPLDSNYPPYYDPYQTSNNPVTVYCWNPDPVKAAFCKGQVDAQRKARRDQIRRAYEEGRGSYRGSY